MTQSYSPILQVSRSPVSFSTWACAGELTSPILNSISASEHSDFIESPPKAITENTAVFYFSDGAENSVSKTRALPPFRKSGCKVLLIMVMHQVPFELEHNTSTSNLMKHQYLCQYKFG
jgi:hypothetical protein